MFGLINENRTKILLLMILLNAILICCLYVKTDRDEVETTSNTKTSDTREEYNQLLLNTYLSNIKEASNNFYDEYYTTSPTVNYYSVFMKNITSDNDTYYVTFTSKPYLGPHDTIGIDEITFSADWHGSVKLEKFNQPFPLIKSISFTFKYAVNSNAFFAFLQ